MRISEQDEFLLSQLLDGGLPEVEAAAVRARILREPELRAALADLERLNGVLVGQRSRQAAVDFAALRRDIMDEVEAARRPAIIRFPMWGRMAGLVAAAAAIAIVVGIYHRAGTPDTPRIEVAVNQPAQQPEPGPAISIPDPTPAPQLADARQEPAPLVVRFNRPSAPRDTRATFKVSYARSDDRATAVKARDTEYRSRPSVRVVVARRSAPVASVAMSPFDSPL